MQGIHQFKQMNAGMDIPEEIPKVILEKIMDEAKEIWRLAKTKAKEVTQKGLGALEHFVREKVLGLGGQMVGWLLERTVGTGYVGTAAPCAECGGSARFVNHRPKTLLSLLMKIPLKRAYYHCGSCGQAQIPLDKTLSIEGQVVSPALKEAVVHVNAEVPFERAHVLLKGLSGVSYDKKEARELTEDFGRALETQTQHEIQMMFQEGKRKPTPVENPQVPERLYLSPDGTTVHMEDGWKEVKIASVFTASVPVKKNEEPERIRTRYVGTTEDSQALGRRLYVEALKQGLEKTKEVVVVADGGAWIWNEAETWLPENRVEILDFFHAKEKLYDVAKVVYGESDARATAWADRWSGVLYKQDAQAVLPALRRLKPEGKTKKEEVRKVIGYFETHRDRMRYGYFRRHGYFIGSGVTESGCKHLVGSRFKQAGMCWNKANVQAVLQARLALLNERWDHLWKPSLN